MKPDPKALYHPLILQHNKAPFHYEKQESLPTQLDAYNPICGDRFQLYLDIKDQRIEQFHFHGYGCAVSKAATSVMIKHLLGKTIEEAIHICEQYESVLENGDGEEADFLPFAVARQFPGREECAMLSWREIKEYLINSTPPIL